MDVLLFVTGVQTEAVSRISNPAKQRAAEGKQIATQKILQLGSFVAGIVFSHLQTRNTLRQHFSKIHHFAFLFQGEDSEEFITLSKQFPALSDIDYYP